LPGPDFVCLTARLESARFEPPAFVANPHAQPLRILPPARGPPAVA
jgi:hypothetical protein